MEKETSITSMPSPSADRTPERRWAILLLGRWEFGELLRCLNQPGVWLTLTSGALPEGARILDVHFDWQRDAFMVRVEHPSFDVVRDGEKLAKFDRLEIQVKANDLAKAMEENRRRHEVTISSAPPEYWSIAFREFT